MKMLAVMMFFGVLASGVACSQAHTVAITIDDLPFVSGEAKPLSPNDARQAAEVNRRILKRLVRRHVPTTGFVVEGEVDELGLSEGSSILKGWIGSGFSLGNHTYSHKGANELTADQFKDDVIKGERTFRPLMQDSHSGLFFRFPFNATGDTKEKHVEIAEFLQRRGYRLTPCTIENEDYNFNAAYVQMLRKHDEVNAKRLRAAYLTYTSEEIDYYTGLNKQVLGYEPPQIMVLHDNQLNADLIDQVLKLFVAKRYRFVTLEEAERDPVYQVSDTFVTKYGMMWGYRWAQERHVKVDGRREKEPPSWITDYGTESQ